MKAYQSLDEFMADLPALAEGARERLRGQSGTYRLQTREGRTLQLRLDDGALTFGAPDGGDVDCTVTASEADLLAVIQGRLNPAKALLFGKVRVQGSLPKLLALIALM